MNQDNIVDLVEIKSGATPQRRRGRPPAAKPACDESPFEAPAYYQYYVKTKSGSPYQNLANVQIACAWEQDLEGLFGWNDFTRTVFVTRKSRALGLGFLDTQSYPRPLAETDLLNAVIYLQRDCYLPGIRKHMVEEAVAVQARLYTFHPVKDYLNGLKGCWDRKPRIEKLFCKYAGAEDSPYTSTVGVIFLLSAIARIYQPGCKVDTVVILIGKQGSGKSTFFEILFGEWFSPCLPDLNANPKDLAMHELGQWGLELPELAASRGAGVERQKAYYSRTYNKYRRPYDRVEVTEPRQCVFVGTTNQSTFLHDSTGNRRFLPVEVGAVDLGAIKDDKDQIWAEAVELFDDGENWWPDADFNEQHAQQHQEQAFESDPWEPKIADFLSDKPLVRIADIATEGLFIPIGNVGTREQRRISGILQRIGWTQGARTKTDRWWIRNDLADGVKK